ncbi:hypothetical protein [Leptospira inadai]|uniref:Uncharacterized protein n=1 Tax=Leptospira inadai serovar Lyme TaxID=293084 RepID=A0ABX4YKP5_9LEPT|nr:hypothetical protein [Leptospira inadai]PNV75587.1 hypothetical protein BES34_008120 [Leptospira inadai serovar Lyme]
MPAPSKEILDILGLDLFPYERRKLVQGRDIEDIPENEKLLVETEFLYNATDNGLPPSPYTVLNFDPSNPPLDHRYLWVLTSKCLFIVLEKIGPKTIKHTNITAGGKAIAGGELWFEFPRRVYINGQSGRYGYLNERAWETVIFYFNSIGYEAVSIEKM